MFSPVKGWSRNQTLPESADDQPADQLHHVLGHDRTSSSSICGTDKLAYPGGPNSRSVDRAGACRSISSVGVPQSVLYDKTGDAGVAHSTDDLQAGDGLVRRLHSHYLVRDRGHPGKRNDKGAASRVGLVFPGANFMVNAAALCQLGSVAAAEDSSTILAGTVIAELPERRGTGSHRRRRPSRAASQAPGQAARPDVYGDYSVPSWPMAHRDVWVTGYVERVVDRLRLGRSIALNPRMARGLRRRADPLSSPDRAEDRRV